MNSLRQSSIRKKAAISVALISVVASITNAAAIEDAVENDGTWTTLVNGSFSTSINGLTPVEGAYFFRYNTTATGGRVAGAWKLFSDTFSAEELKVTYSIGDQTSPYSLVPGFDSLLFADINGDNGFSYSERIIPTTVVSHTTPVDGWQQWEDRYIITADTMTAGGDPVLGKKIGFFVQATVNANQDINIDSLSITPVTSPRQLSLMVISN